MNEPNFSVEFVLPEHLQAILDNVSNQVVDLMIGMFGLLYPDGDIPENAENEVLVLLGPKLSSSIAEAANKALEELG